MAWMLSLRPFVKKMEVVHCPGCPLSQQSLVFLLHRVTVLYCRPSASGRHLATCCKLYQYACNWSGCKVPTVLRGLQCQQWESGKSSVFTVFQSRYSSSIVMGKAQYRAHTKHLINKMSTVLPRQHLGVDKKKRFLVELSSSVVLRVSAVWNSSVSAPFVLPGCRLSDSVDT